MLQLYRDDSYNNDMTNTSIYRSDESNVIVPFISFVQNNRIIHYL